MQVFIMLIIWILGFYPCSGEVVEYSDGVSVIETSDGNLWECYDRLYKGQKVSILLYDNGTPEAEDDIIIHIWRNHNG